MSGPITSAVLRESVSLQSSSPSPRYIPFVGDELILSVDVDGSQPAAQVFKGESAAQIDLLAAVCMPISQDGWLEAHIFRPHHDLYNDGFICPTEVLRQYGERGLVPNPRAHKAVVSANSAIFKEIPTASVWMSELNSFCHAEMEWKDDNGRLRSTVSKRLEGFDYRWWFVGVPV